MASRKDQLHSYQFMLQRAISALVMRETDPAQSPLRRGVGAAFVGVMVAVIVAAAFGIYGLLTKAGSAKWKVDNAVVVEKETGAPFVYTDGRLAPALNYTSALLIAGQAPPKTFTVPSNSLAGVERGLERGIAGAPSGLPAKSHVLKGDWTACAVPAKTASGQATVTTSLRVGSGSPAGPALGEDGLLVQDAGDRNEYLIWHGHRYELPNRTLAAALFAGTNPEQVGPAWLNTLPVGDPIDAIKVPDSGSDSHAVPGRQVGQVVTDKRDTGEIDYLVLDGGLAKLTGFQLDVLRAGRSVTTVTMQPAEIAAAPKSNDLTSDSPAEQQLPARTPRLAETPSGSGPCAAFSPGQGTPSVAVQPNAGAGAGTPTGSRTAGGSALADEVSVPGGSAAVVRALESGTFSLVTDVGTRFPVESADVLAMLGYAASDAVALPAALLNRLPTGPALTRSGALHLASASGN